MRDWTTWSADVAGLSVNVREKGSGVTTVALHHSTGPYWGEVHDCLANSHRVVAPDLPGYGASDRPTFARSPRDVAILCNQLLMTAQLADVNLIGFGFGGWIAAEMATMNQERLRTLTLIGAAGLRPNASFIHDPLLAGWIEYIRLGLSDQSTFDRLFGVEPSHAVLDAWDRSREMTARLTWKPWMWSAQLPHLLRGVRTPTLLLWGECDQIVPVECADLYAQALACSELRVLPGLGHVVELEQPQEVAKAIGAFIADQSRTA